MSSPERFPNLILWMNTRTDIKAKLSERKQKEAATENENRVVDKVVENASMEIPEPMVESQVTGHGQ